MPEVYCKTLKRKVHRAGCSEQKASNADVQCNAPLCNAHPCTAAHTRAVLEHFNWELFDNSPYSPYLASSDYHLFAYLKNWLGSQRFTNNELMEGVKTWLSSQVADFFDTGIQILICLYDQCLNSGGDYVEK
jgi:hypothetical protein